MRPIVANSISEAFESAIKLTQDWATSDPPLLWFRGVRDSNLSLQPGAYWRPNYAELNPLITFTQEGARFAPLGSLADWETYYLAQHHGIPTRLLDWTESFSAALFFAFDGWNGQTTPCIWILQPAALNERFLKWHGIPAPEASDETTLWLPKVIARRRLARRQDDEGCIYDNRHPIAIYPQQTNPRLAAQQGTFTVHGRHRDPLDKLIEKARGNPRKILARIEHSGFDTTRVYRDLALLGLRRAAIYPDVDNFVLQIQEQYGWQ